LSLFNGTAYKRIATCVRSVNSHLDTVQMKAVQLKMARAAVGWGVRELAEKAGVTANTVTRIENGADAKQSTMDALQRALESAGVEFTNGGQPGVRMKKAGGSEHAARLQRQQMTYHLTEMQDEFRSIASTIAFDEREALVIVRDQVGAKEATFCDQGDLTATHYLWQGQPGRANQRIDVRIRKDVQPTQTNPSIPANDRASNDD
jgi:transcriptional regulator with XRE-family HTH domain